MGRTYIDQYYLQDGILIDASVELATISNEKFVAYEVLRVMLSAPLFYDDHIERLLHSLNGLGIDTYKLCKKDILSQIDRLIKSNSKTFGNVEIRVITDNLAILHIYVGFVLHHYPEPLDYIQGVFTDLIEVERDTPNLKLKHSNARLQANKMLANASLYEVLLVNKIGQITEGSKSNVFFIINGKVITSPENLILKGITRNYALMSLESLGIDVEFRSILAKDLHLVDAAFLCGTSPGILPIRAISNVVLDVNHVLVRKVMERYNLIVNQYLKGSFV